MSITYFNSKPSAKLGHLGPGETHPSQRMPLEARRRDGSHRSRYLKDHFRVLADFALRVRIEPQHEEAEQVVQIDLPIPFGIERERQGDARDLPGKAEIDQLFVARVGNLRTFFQNLLNLRRGLRGEGSAGTTLFVVIALRSERFGLGQEKFVPQYRVTAGDFVYASGAVTNPLPRHEDRQFDVEGEYDLLEGARMFVPPEIIDERGIFAVALRALAIRDARRLDDALISSKIVDEAHEAFVEHRELFIEDRFCFGNTAMGHERIVAEIPQVESMRLSHNFSRHDTMGLMNSKIEVTFQRLPGDVLKIFFRACEEIHCDEPLLELGEFEVSALCHALGNECRDAEAASGVQAAKLAEPRSRFVLVNGWQSWSFAGELAGGERPRRACYKRALNLFVDHPAEVALRQRARRFGHRHDHISHFMLGLRAADLRLMLVSDNAARYQGALQAGGISGAAAADRVERGTQQARDASTGASAGHMEGRPAANTTLDAYLPPLSFLLRDKTIRVFAYAEGASFARGEVIARVVVLIAPDYFALKDRLGKLWGAPRRFDDLRWLSSGAAYTPAGVPAPAAPEQAVKPEMPAPAPASPFKGVIGGYVSWYNHYTAIDERVIGEDLESIKANDNIVNTYFIERGRPTVFQIDDGWELAIGDWQAHPEKFPDGMARMASRIVEKALVPGIWLAPFLLMPGSDTAKAHPDWVLRDTSGAPVKAGWNPNWGGDVWTLDLSLPEVEDHLVGLFDTVVNGWGYRYLKLDFLYAGLMRGAFAGRKGGAWQHYARVMARILEFSYAADGSPVAFLSCGAPIESTAPFMPLMRSGADTREHWEWPQAKLIGHQGRPSAKINMEDSIGRAILDKTLLLCDPDVIFCRTGRTSLRDTEKFLVGMLAAMFGSQIMSSDDPAAFGKNPPSSHQLAEETFTQQLMDWYGRMGGKEFGVERSHLRARDVYHFFTRDRSIYGGINLSDREGMFMLSGASGDTGGSEPDATAGESARPSTAAPLPRHSLLIFGA